MTKNWTQPQLKCLLLTSLFLLGASCKTGFQEKEKLASEVDVSSGLQSGQQNQTGNPPQGGNQNPPPVSTPPPSATPAPAPAGMIDGISATAAGTYPVYAGCEAPATTYKRTLYIDPVNGSDSGAGTAAAPLKTLAAAFNAKKILAGDHVILKAGDHGSVLVTKYNNTALETATEWIWLDFQPGATAQSFDIRDMTRWKVTGGTFINEGSVYLMSFSGGSQIVVADNLFTGGLDSSTWSASRWINASSAFGTRNTKCTSVLRNRALNVRFGFSCSTDFKLADENRMNNFFADNEVKNYSADGFRIICSNLHLKNNKILDSYVSDADGDTNHDDAIQGFALNGAIFDNVLIEGTYVQETTDLSRPLQAGVQGISSFDGTYTNVTIRKNVVLASAYHGIGWYGSENVLIEKNTVISTTPAHVLWIGTFKGKDGTLPKNVTIRDNVASSVGGDNPSYVNTGNAIYGTSTLAAANFVKFDLATMQFDLHLKSTSADYGAGKGAY